MCFHIHTCLHVGDFICNVSSTLLNTIKVTCELFGNLTRVNAIINCTSCTGKFTTYSIVDDSPFVISNLPAGNYTVDVSAVNISIVDIETVEVIVMSENIKPPTSGPTNNVPTTESVPCKYSS